MFYAQSNVIRLHLVIVNNFVRNKIDADVALILIKKYSKNLTNHISHIMATETVHSV